MKVKMKRKYTNIIAFVLTVCFVILSGCGSVNTINLPEDGYEPCEACNP